MQNKKQILKLSIAIIIFIIGFWLKSVFNGSIILNQTINFGKLHIYYYGLILATAVICAYLVADFRKAKFKISSSLQDKLIFWLIIGGFIGARVYHVLTDYKLYVNNFSQIFAVWNGGLSIYGAIFGGIITLWIISFYFKEYKLNFLKVLDWLTPSLLIGQIIGRFGNLFNYELYGFPSSLPFKMFVPTIFRLSGYAGFQYFHPLFLYEILANLIILWALLFLERKNRLITGQLFLSYIFLYNTIRFGLEFLRIDAPIYNGIHINALVSLGLALVALWLLYLIVYASKISQNH